MFQFPASPTLGQTYTPITGTTYSFDGTGWVLVGRSAEDSANFVQRIGDSMYGPLLHPDGTRPAPSIAFSAAPGTGIARMPGGELNIMIATTPIVGISTLGANVVGTFDVSGVLTTQSSVGIGTNLYLNNGRWMYGKDTSAVDQPMMVLWTDDNMYVGQASPNLYLRAASGQIRIGAGTVAIAGNTTITGTGVVTGRFDANYIVVPNQNGGGYYYVNTAAGTPLNVLYADAANNLLHGQGGWPAQYFYTNSAERFHIDSGGTYFNGPVYGITASMVGLGNVTNQTQVYNSYPPNGTLGMNWNGSQMTVQIGGTDHGGQWPVDITGRARRMYTAEGVDQTFSWAIGGGNPVHMWGNPGTGANTMYYPSQLTVGYATSAGNANRAAYVSNSADHASTAFIFRWSDPGGVPGYVWGSSDGTNMYVYQTSRLNVNNAVYATSSGYANNSNAVNNVSGWNYSNRSKNPSYVWVTDGNTWDQYLTEPWYLRPAWAYRVDSVDTASGGQINGLLRVRVDSWGGSGPSGAYNALPVISETSMSAYPGVGLHRPGAAGWATVIYYDNSMWFGANNDGGPYGGWAFRIDGNGNVHAAGYNNSLRTLTDTTPLTGALLDVVRLRGVRGLNVDTQTVEIGIVGDDLERAFPELVHVISKEDGSPLTKSVNYMMLLAPMIEAIRELSDRVIALESR